MEILQWEPTLVGFVNSVFLEAGNNINFMKLTLLSDKSMHLPTNRTDEINTQTLA